MNQAHLFDPAIMRRVKSVIHARGQPQRDELPVAVLLSQRRIAEQVRQRIGRALDLVEFVVANSSERADNAIRRADHDRRIGIGRPQAGTKLAGETVVHALEFALPGFRKVELGEQPPACDRQVAHERIFDLAEPAHEAGQRGARDTIGQEEIEIFLLCEGGDESFHCHEFVSRTG